MISELLSPPSLRLVVTESGLAWHRYGIGYDTVLKVHVRPTKGYNDIGNLLPCADLGK
jgi:hypothetical protein